MRRRTFLHSVAALTFAARLRGETTATKNVPWLADVQQPPTAALQKPVQLTPLLVDTAGRPITSADAWPPRREALRKQWLEFLGPLSRQHLDAGRQGPVKPPAVEVLGEERVDGIARTLIRYEVEQGQPVEAYLLKPTNLTAKAPGVVVFHSTVNESLRQPAGVEGAPEKAFGLELAKRGCVTICPRNYLWPQNHGIDAKGEAARFLQRHPQSKGMDRMLLDGLIAVDLLLAQPEVDAGRIGSIGHSLGAKEVLYLAAFDERVKVTVSSEGGIGTTFSNWHDAWYLGEAIRQPGFAREHHELLALVAPRPFLLVGGDSADGDPSWPFIEAALPVYQLLGTEPAPLGLLNHKQGHSVPPAAFAKMLAWMMTYL